MDGDIASAGTAAAALLTGSGPRHVFECIDGHTAGNPVRLVVEGGPPLRDAGMSERRQQFLAEYDWIRTA